MLKPILDRYCYSQYFHRLFPFKLFTSKSPSSSTAWLSFWGTVRAIALKRQRQQWTKPHLLLNFDNIFLVCQYIPINIANIHFKWLQSNKNNHLVLRGSGKGAVEVGVGGGKGARRGRREYIINKKKEAKRMISITKDSVLLLSLQ